jgi:hypothetical protein
MIIIGGTGRNIGKTHLAEMVIKKLAGQSEVIAVKISNVNPGNRDLHGTHEMVVEGDFLIYEEKDRTGGKDSMRFLRAGAKRSFFIITDDGHLSLAFDRLMMTASKPNSVMVCESNALRNWVVPNLFVMVSDVQQRGKKDMKKLFALADAVVPALDQVAFDDLVSKIKISNGKIVL